MFSYLSKKIWPSSFIVFTLSFTFSLFFRKPLRLTWSVSSRTPTCAPSTPSVSPSCPRTSSSPDASEARGLKSATFFTFLKIPKNNFKQNFRQIKYTAKMFYHFKKDLVYKHNLKNFFLLFRIRAKWMCSCSNCPNFHLCTRNKNLNFSYSQPHVSSSPKYKTNSLFLFCNSFKSTLCTSSQVFWINESIHGITVFDYL